MLQKFCGRWWVLLLKGIAAVVLGVCAIVWPGITLVTLAYMFAIFTLIDGVVALILGFRGESDGTVWWTMVALGVLAVAAGVIAFAWPGITLVALLAVIAASAIVRGVFEIAAAVRLRKEIDDEWILGLSGFMSIVFGALILYRPDAGLLAMALFVGAYMLAIGVLAIALSLRMRRMGSALTATR
jgi:uncharacterized membrane protein HdeD (DUF308 family)